MMYVPILDTLQTLLNCDGCLFEVGLSRYNNYSFVITISLQISHGHQHGELLSDYCDGKIFKKHPLFSVHSEALQIFFYFDDLEVCNPLGSKAKIHKISKL